MAILFVTHFLDQTYAISDRITVMRNGEREGEYLAADLSRVELVNKMVGAPVAEAGAGDGRGRLRCGRRRFKSFLRAVGLGRKALLRRWTWKSAKASCSALPACWAPAAPRRRACCSAPTGRQRQSPSTAGTQLASPRDAIAAGIGFCSEDRKHEGAILDLSVRENMILAAGPPGIMRAIPLKRQQQLAEEYVKALGIKTASIETPIGSLSGGNQQKVLLARWLVTDPGC
jgi:simple sugar transport system ATP-binding protein